MLQDSTSVSVQCTQSFLLREVHHSSKVFQRRLFSKQPGNKVVRTINLFLFDKMPESRNEGEELINFVAFFEDILRIMYVVQTSVSASCSALSSLQCTRSSVVPVMLWVWGKLIVLLKVFQTDGCSAVYGLARASTLLARIN